MKTTKIAVLALALCCTACVNSTGTNPVEETVDFGSEKDFSSQLSLIEGAFQKGDSKKACDLNAKLSQKTNFTENISRESLQALKEFQVKCLQALTSDFKGFLKE